MGNPVIHIELAGKDGPELEHFYRSLFDWDIEHRGEGATQYGFVQDGSAGPTGVGIRHEPEGIPEVVAYVQVDDLEEVLEHAMSLGGTVRIPAMNTGTMRFAMIMDPEGNPMGLIEKPKDDEES
jgi:predicted enzyme related to lactoylglutathione lyase